MKPIWASVDGYFVEEGQGPLFSTCATGHPGTSSALNLGRVYG